MVASRNDIVSKTHYSEGTCVHLPRSFGRRSNLGTTDSAFRRSDRYLSHGGGWTGTDRRTNRLGSGGGARMSVLKLFELASRMDKVGLTVTRVGLIVVLLWIGGLKAFRYEADGIV